MTLTKKQADTMGKELNVILTQFAEKHGMTLKRDRITYSNTMFRRKIEFQIGSVEEANRRNWDANCWMFDGLDKGLFGAEFTHKGVDYKIVNIAPRSKKYPVLAKELLTGKTYKFSNKIFIEGEN